MHCIGKIKMIASLTGCGFVLQLCIFKSYESLNCLWYTFRVDNQNSHPSIESTFLLCYQN